MTNVWNIKQIFSSVFSIGETSEITHVNDFAQHKYAFQDQIWQLFLTKWQGMWYIQLSPVYLIVKFRES